MIKQSTVFLLIASIFCGFAFSQTAAGDKTSGDEIAKMKQEIQQLRILLKELAQVLSGDQKEKLKEIIKQLEEKIAENQNQPGESETAKTIDEVKQSIQKVKDDISQATGGIQFNGFFDVSASGYKNSDNIFILGDFELDMAKSFGENFQVASALVFADDGTRMDVGFIDFHLFGGSISARGRLFSEKGFHIQVGRFDVPFGNDWQFNSSADRVSVTAPLTTDLVLDGGYNDVGLRILKSAVVYNYTIYMVKGIEKGFALGGRFVLTPFNSTRTLKRKELREFEVGVSYLYDISKSGSPEQKVLALDFESSLGPLRLQGEYIRRDWNIVGALLKGAHLSAFLDASKFSSLPITFFSRYDYFRQAAIDGRFTLDRLTLGININLYDISLLKFEYSHFFKGNDQYNGSSYYAQMVITF